MHKFISFINSLDFGNISSQEQELLKNEVFKDWNVTKQAREFIIGWLDSRVGAKPPTPQKLTHENKEIKMKSY